MLLPSKITIEDKTMDGLQRRRAVCARLRDECGKAASCRCSLHFAICTQVSFGLGVVPSPKCFSYALLRQM